MNTYNLVKISNIEDLSIYCQQYIGALKKKKTKIYTGIFPRQHYGSTLTLATS